MRLLTLRRSGALLLFWLLLYGLAQWAFLQRTLLIQHSQSARLVAYVIGRVLAHAHRANDDLTQQMAIQSLSRAPGILLAYVIDANGKVLAHASPARLGQVMETLPRGTSSRSVWVSPLPEATAPPQRLVFALSKRTLQQSMAQLFGILTVGNAGILIIAIGVGMCWRLDQRKQAKFLEDLQSQKEDQNREIERLRLVLENSEKMWMSWLQSAAEYIPRPALLLDQTQRVIACNRAARTWLELAADEPIIKRSWQDIERLASYGVLIQRSIDTPGQELEAPINGGAIKICFLTEPQLTKSGISTWVFLS